MRTVELANLALRFLLELCALGALYAWGSSSADGGAAPALGLGAPLLFAVGWGLFASPRARVRLTPLRKAVVQVTLLLLPALALVDLGRPVLAGGLAGLVLANAVLLHLTGRSPRQESDLSR